LEGIGALDHSRALASASFGQMEKQEEIKISKNKSLRATFIFTIAPILLSWPPEVNME
jgi:hypothetical protein